jgi:hypothetical protein
VRVSGSTHRRAKKKLAAEIFLIQTHAGSFDETSTRFPEFLLTVASVPLSKDYDVRIVDQ